MLKSAVSKLMWLGRATSAVVGLAILVALAVGAANSALAHTNVDNKLFHLNHNNAVTKLSKLTGNLAGAVLKVDNNGTGPALSLEAQAGQAPLTVNATAGKATNLNADKLDDREASSFADATHAHSGEDITSGLVAEGRIDGSIARDTEIMERVTQQDGSGSTLDADLLDGKDSSEFASSYIFATVDRNGNLLSQASTSHAVSSSRASTGLYLVNFNRDIRLITGCVHFAQSTDVFVPAITTTSDGPRYGGPNTQVRVELRDHANNLTDNEFSLAVFCK